jgi:hypothetical protein
MAAHTPIFPSRFVRVEEARARFGDRVDRVGALLFSPDQLADEAIVAMEQLPKGEGQRMVNQLSASGPSAVSGAPPALGRLVEAAFTVPAWVDWDAVNTGGAVLLRSGILGGMVLGAQSLPLGYASPGGNKPLVLSGRLEQQAQARLNETARFVQAVCRPGGMRPGSQGHTITLRVRLMHAQVRRMILRTDRWKMDAWGLPINQHDMASTQLLFSSVVLDGLGKLGVSVSPDDAERYMHLWRWVSHVIGVTPELAPASLADADRLTQLVTATQADPDDDSRALTRALLFAERNAARTDRVRRSGAAKAHLGAVFMRMLCGDQLSDKLGVAHTPLELTGPLLRRLVRTTDLVMRAVPGAEARALASGLRYWDRVIAVGMAQATAEFGLPEALLAA